MKSSLSSDATTELPAVDAERWVEKYGDVLFGFAAGRVRDRAIAEDLVQETFLAALKASEGFAGRSSERAWLFGILRNKLVDYYRRQSREVSLGEVEEFLPEERGAFRAQGFHKDGWDQRLAPKAWETPEESLQNKEFQSVLKTCMSRLPERIAAVFMMREIDGASTEQICSEVGVSGNNVCVMLHRARMSLRRCLEIHWFGKKPQRNETRRAGADGEEESC
jgi:RNA polymerase sigma-70 factor, ECF subfamily